MKKSIFLLAVIFISMSSYGQFFKRDTGQGESNNEIRTLAGRNQYGSGIYGGFGGGYTLINDADAVTLTGRGAWIAGHSLAFGFAGTGFVSSFTPGLDPDHYENLTGGYGGVLIEPILLPKFPVHLSFPIIAGFGGIASTSSVKPSNSWEYTDTFVQGTEAYLVAEPGVELEVNVLKFFRMAFGLSYRFTTDLTWSYSAPDVLEGWNAGMTFKFGKF
jgi:hypothetical protein